MTEATVIERLDTFVPGLEVATLEITEGETYIAKKLSTITGLIISGNQDVDAHLNATWSGTTVTLHYAAQTDKDVTLVLFGRP